MVTRMSGKAPFVAALFVLLAAGCSTVRETAPGAPAPAPLLATAEPKPQPTPAADRPAPAKRPSKPAPPAPQPASRTSPAAGIDANVTREPGGKSLLVSRGADTQPVPLFRQAIVLADVRATLAGLPAQPKAEFQRGLLTLTFPRGNQSEVTAAINKALAVPEVTRLRANLPP